MKKVTVVIEVPDHLGSAEFAEDIHDMVDGCSHGEWKVTWWNPGEGVSTVEPKRPL